MRDISAATTGEHVGSVQRADARICILQQVPAVAIEGWFSTRVQSDCTDIYSWERCVKRDTTRTQFGNLPIRLMPPFPESGLRDVQHALRFIRSSHGAQIMPINDGRIQWVDTARGVGIILVVFGHVLRGLNDAGLIQGHSAFAAVDAAIYLFHMPLFFALSGLFFEQAVLRRTFWASLAGRVESLLYPIVIWSYFVAISKVVAGGAASNPVGGWWDVVLYPFPPKDIFWFLWAMFAIQTISSIVVVAKPQRFAYGLLFTASLVLCVAFPPDNWPYLVGVIVEFLPYFVLGLLLGFLGRKPVDSLPLLAAGATAFVVAEALLFVFPASAGPAYLILRLLATIGALMTLSWVGSRGTGKGLQMLAYFGVSSMAIYVMHTVITSAVRTVLVRLGIESIAPHLIAATVLGLLVPCAALWMIDRLRLRRVLGLGKNARPASTPLGRSPAATSR